MSAEEGRMARSDARGTILAGGIVAAAKNYLLPAWMIGFGVWLVIRRRSDGRGDR